MWTLCPKPGTRRFAALVSAVSRRAASSSGIDSRKLGDVIGDATLGRGASIVRSTVWSGSRVGDGARLRDCVLARGRVPAGADYRESLLWAADEDAEVAAIPL